MLSLATYPLLFYIYLANLRQNDNLAKLRTNMKRGNEIPGRKINYERLEAKKRRHGTLQKSNYQIILATLYTHNYIPINLYTYYQFKSILHIFTIIYQSNDTDYLFIQNHIINLCSIQILIYTQLSNYLLYIYLINYNYYTHSNYTKLHPITNSTQKSKEAHMKEHTQRKSFKSHTHLYLSLIHI